jgi:glycosyltransferase involved in cell wall biosynthesis
LERQLAIRLLILTDFNVSNIHYMLAAELQDEPRLLVRYLDCGPRKLRENDWRWFSSDDNSGDFAIEDRRAGLLGLLRRLLAAAPAVISSDVVLVSGWIGVLPRLLGKRYVYWSYGSDLDQYAFHGASVFEYRGIDLPRKSVVSAVKRMVLKAGYRAAIAGSAATIVSPYQRERLAAIGYRQLAFVPHAREPDYLQFRLQDKPRYRRELQARFDADWLCFSGTRHVWDERTRGEADYKGNDVALRAFAQFLAGSPAKRAKLLLIDRGRDAARSKQLAVDLGIQQQVVWLPEMPRRQLLPFYAGADVCFDQFSVGCLALSAIEAMACGAPTVSYIGSPVNGGVPFYATAPPVLNLNNPRDIAAALKRLHGDSAYAAEMERSSFEWVQRECSAERRRSALLDVIDAVLAAG